MTDAGEKLDRNLEQRALAMFASKSVTSSTMSLMMAEFCRDELERAARIAEQPYSDEVGALGHHQPFAVGQKIAAAIRKLKE